MATLTKVGGTYRTPEFATDAIVVLITNDDGAYPLVRGVKTGKTTGDSRGDVAACLEGDFRAR